MAAVKGGDTKPELEIRSLVHRSGYRFRLHGKGLPGKPDIVLPRLKKVIFVHGCFWHGHKKCLRGQRPSSNKSFWNRKLDLNIERDKRNLLKLQKSGWTPLVVWGCELKKSDRLYKKLAEFLKK